MVQVNQILTAGKLLPSSAASLRGRVIFSEQQCHGRMGAMATTALGVRARQNAGPFGLDDEIMKALRFVTGPLKTARPREIDFKDPRPPVVVFTDGACEGTDD
eukprot:11177199-Karenia_brevis.AAC.1